MFKPERIKFDEIRNRADEFRKKYLEPPDKIPVPIEEIVEIDLEIIPQPIKGLRQKVDIEGFLSKDLKYIFVDEDIYFDDRWLNRLRFTYAHEVGHLVLHRDIIEQCEFRTEEGWIKFREGMSEEDLLWFELQAYEFAGRLLVPRNKLIQEIKNYESEIHKYRDKFDDEDMLITAVARMICGKFIVSEDVISRRIKKENSCKNLFC